MKRKLIANQENMFLNNFSLSCEADEKTKTNKRKYQKIIIIIKIIKFKLKKVCKLLEAVRSLLQD